LPKHMYSRFQKNKTPLSSIKSLLFYFDPKTVLANIFVVPPHISIFFFNLQKFGLNPLLLIVSGIFRSFLSFFACSFVGYVRSFTLY
jgi:hypothetical protein